MSYLPIILGITRSSSDTPDKSRASSGRSASLSGKDLPSNIKDKILARDNQACRCCGFRSEKYQQILFRNGDFSDLREDNLATTCIFCHQCFHLDTVHGMKSGALIWMPEIEQYELHHMARAIYVARISQGPIAETARKTLDLLMARREEAIARISTDNPYILSKVLRDYLLPGHYKARAKKLDGIRLFPLERRMIKEADLEFNQFPQILAYWRSKNGPFGGKPPAEWVSLYQKIGEQAA